MKENVCLNQSNQYETFFNRHRSLVDERIKPFGRFLFECCCVTSSLAVCKMRCEYVARTSEPPWRHRSSRTVWRERRVSQSCSPSLALYSIRTFTTTSSTCTLYFLHVHLSSRLLPYEAAYNCHEGSHARYWHIRLLGTHLHHHCTCLSLLQHCTHRFLQWCQSTRLAASARTHPEPFCPPYDKYSRKYEHPPYVINFYGQASCQESPLPALHGSRPLASHAQHLHKWYHSTRLVTSSRTHCESSLNDKYSRRYEHPRHTVNRSRRPIPSRSTIGPGNGLTIASTPSLPRHMRTHVPGY